MGSVEGEGVTVERGVKGIGGDRGKSRDEGSVWGVLFLPLSFLVFLVLGAGDTQEGSDEEEDAERRVPVCQRRGAPRALKVLRPKASKVRPNNRWFATPLRKSAERQDEGGTCRVEATPCRSWSRCPNAVARERGGNLRTRVAVSWGIPWIYPRDRARRKVEREGEPKQR